MDSNINTDLRPLDAIESAIEDIKQGKVVIVVDDDDRENEGDFICAAEKITPEIVNFMATHGRGLICAPLTEERCEELGLELMVGRNTALHATPFTVSVDLIGHGCTTGISASDRAKTIQALVAPETDPHATVAARTRLSPSPSETSSDSITSPSTGVITMLNAQPS